MATNKERIDSLENQVSGLSGKLDKILDKLNSGSAPVKDEYNGQIDSSGKIKILDGSLPEMTTEEALQSVDPEPMLMGEIPMDRYGQITDPSWTREKGEDGSEVYIKKDVHGNEIKRINTFDVDQNRKKLDAWREKNKAFQRSMELSNMETRNPEIKEIIRK